MSITGFDAAQARYDRAEPPFVSAGAEDGYERYLADHESEARQEWEAAMAAGHTDPCTFDEWYADTEEPLDFGDWIDEREEALRDEAADRQFERMREERWT